MNKSSCIPSSFKNKSTVHSQCLALESRLVFDGAVVATAVEAQTVVNNDHSAEHASVTPTEPAAPTEPTVNLSPDTTPQAIDYRPNANTTSDQPAFPTATDLLHSINSTFVTGANTDQATTIIVVDPRAENAAALSLNPPVNTQVMILDSTRDGFQQVAEQLQSRQDVTELHLVPWIKDNQQWLGSKALTATLEPSVSDSLMSWNDGLADNAKVLFHGQNSMGTTWLEHISALTSTQASWFDQNDTTLLTDNPPTATTLVFIDSAVQDSADIISAIDPTAEIVYLDAKKDGLTQIADYLEGRSGIDNIQIISHGNQAALHLGNEILTNDNLADHTDELATIGKSLTVNGDILLYGCELAKSTEGSQFIDTFAYLTQADVAASTDITGAASKNGNWTLEYTAGTIEASILAASHYQDILALPSFNVTGIPLVFNQPILQNGNGQNTGDVVIFNNVATIDGQVIDAVVTTVNNTDINIIGFDSASGVLGAPLNPNWFELDTQSIVSGGASIIKFEFIKSGTYNPATGLGEDVLLQNLIVNSYDIDNGQFQDFSGFSSYTVASNTTLAQSTPGDFVHFADAIPAPNNNTGVPGSPVFNQARVTATYDSINTFQIKTGSTQILTPEDAGIAHFYLDFSDGYTWNTPVTYGIPTADPLTTNDFTPTLTGTYKPNVIGSTDTAQSLSVTVNGVTYTSTNGLIPTNGLTWSNGTWRLDIPPANALPPTTYDVGVDTGYGPDVNNINPHTKDITINELIVINDPPVNTAPVGQTVNVGVQTAILGLSTTDINDNLASTNLSVVGGLLNVDLTGGATISSGANGTGVLTLSGTEAQIKAALATVKYTANNGISSDTLSILSTDQLGLTDLDTVAINVNRPPIAVDDTKTGVVGTPITVNVLGNDSDPDNNLDPTTVKIVGATNPGDPLVVAGQGTWSVNATTGEITFTPIAGFTLSPTPINYTVKDTSGLESATAKVTLTVINPPIAVDDTKTGNAGTPIIVNVLGNDSDPDNNLDPTTVKIAGTTNPGDPLVVAGQGTWSVNATTGEITFTPIAGFTLSPTPINYTVKDTNGLESATAKVTLTVSNPPIAVDDTKTGNAGTPITVNVLGNDSDPDNNLDPTTVKIAGTTNPGDPLVVAGQGTWSVNATTGEITFTPIAGFTLSPTPISYTVKDTSGLESSAATITMKINSIPIAIADINTVNEGNSTVTGNIITNEATLGDEPTVVMSASQGNTPIPIGSVFITAAGGFLIINSDGSYRYTAPSNLPNDRLIETFNYTIIDSNGDISNSVLTILGPNLPIVSGSVILLTNLPSSPIFPDIEINFFSTPILINNPIEFENPLDLKLYIPTPDGVISLTGSLRDQVVLELQRFSFDIPRWAFQHTNPNAQLEFEATQPDGSPLPNWLRFNPKLLVFSGIPPKGAHNEEVMVTATDAYGNEVHALFNVHVNKERVLRPDHKSLSVDPKLMGLPNKAFEKHSHKEKPAPVSKSSLTERIHAAGKLGKLQESRVLLDSLKGM
ncbi:MAG: DUF4347 domain-containing protein [Methylococcaceae bacterium]|nr:DUF4347 domain-containing protein [Methylococcaceae bacterium]